MHASEAANQENGLIYSDHKVLYSQAKG